MSDSIMASRPATGADNGLPRANFPDLVTPAYLMAYCVQLEMVCDRLGELAPGEDETCSAERRRRWARAQGFLKAARTSLKQLMTLEGNGS